MDAVNRHLVACAYHGTEMAVTLGVSTQTIGRTSCLRFTATDGARSEQWHYPAANSITRRRQQKSMAAPTHVGSERPAVLAFSRGKSRYRAAKYWFAPPL